MARGTWLFDRGIAKRVLDADLNAFIKAYWPEDKRDRFIAFCDGEARPNTPHPYVVYEKIGRPVLEGHSTGSLAGQTQEYQSLAISYRCHAKSTETQSAKAVAAEVAERIAEVFGPDAEPLEICPDYNYQTINQGDWHVREGDDECVWVLHYEYLIDGSNPSTKTVFD